MACWQLSAQWSVELGLCIISSVVPDWRTWPKHDWSFVVPITDTHVGTGKSTRLCFMHWRLMNGGLHLHAGGVGVGCVSLTGQAAHFLERGRGEQSPVHPICVASSRAHRRERPARVEGQTWNGKLEINGNGTYLFHLFNRAPVDMGVGSDMVGNGDALVPGTAWCCLRENDQMSKHASGLIAFFLDWRMSATGKGVDPGGQGSR